MAQARTLDDLAGGHGDSGVLLFKDTFTNYFNPRKSAWPRWNLLKGAGITTTSAPNACCGVL